MKKKNFAALKNEFVKNPKDMSFNNLTALKNLVANNLKEMEGWEEAEETFKGDFSGNDWNDFLKKFLVLVDAELKRRWSLVENKEKTLQELRELFAMAAIGLSYDDLYLYKYILEQNKADLTKSESTGISVLVIMEMQKKFDDELEAIQTEIDCREK